MSWVDAEYAGELAVLSTWIVALLPWSTSVISLRLGNRDVTVVIIRFLYVRLQYVFGVSFGSQERPVLLFTDAPAFNPDALALASWLWVAAAVVSLVPVALSVAYYAREDAFEASIPVDPVRAQGVLLGLVGGLLFASTAYFFAGQRVTVPVGALFALVFAFVLVTVERA